MPEAIKLYKIMQTLFVICICWLLFKYLLIKKSVTGNFEYVKRNGSCLIVSTLIHYNRILKTSEIS